MKTNTDIQSMVDAITRMSESFSRNMKSFSESMRRAFDRSHPLFIRLRLRLKVAEADQYILTDDWQSPDCSAWLHASCVQWRLPGIECACTCHGGHLK